MGDVAGDVATEHRFVRVALGCGLEPFEGPALAAADPGRLGEERLDLGARQRVAHDDVALLGIVAGGQHETRGAAAAPALAPGIHQPFDLK